MAARNPVQFRWGDSTSSEDMDMTPMVDVTFLLLIFFMITAAFAMQKSFRVPVPNRNQPSTEARTIDDLEQDSDVVVVRIDQFNTYHVAAADWDQEEEAPTPHDLLVKLRKARSGDRGGARRLLIMAHGDALHERVIKAIDAGNEVAMEDVKIVTVEDDF